MKTTSALVLGVIVAGFAANAQELTKQGKIERILALTNADATVNQIFSQIKTMVASQAPSGATPEQIAKAQEIQDKLLDLIKGRISWDKIRPQYLRIYDETFSVEEIDGIFAFYESPAGRAMLEKMPSLISKAMTVAQSQMADIMPEIERISKEVIQKPQ
jgi:uncharacterized protein